MKKMLKILTIFLSSSSIALSVTACNSQPNWNNIPIPPPEIPIQVTGFQGVDFKSMNIKDYDTVDKLFKAIKEKLVNTLWADPNATTWTGTKDGKAIDLSFKDSDLKRNGQYKFEIKSNISFPGNAKFIITITSSHHIADNLKITNLGQIDDLSDKTILIASVFKNMNLVQKINEIADEYLCHITIDTKDKKPNYDTPINGTAILTSTDKGYFYGSVTVNFIVKLKHDPKQPYDLKDEIKIPNLGQITDNRQYTILMYVIIKNFVSKLDSLSEIVNNLNIFNIHKTSATVSSIENSKYFTGSIEVKFIIQK